LAAEDVPDRVRLRVLHGDLAEEQVLGSPLGEVAAHHLVESDRRHRRVAGVLLEPHAEQLPGLG
ncbi:MAG TPA: hypothetical protein VFV02_03105, partial [Acidimicrobiales bacterium]|nr:hypothetical protein [Acidimicrobiales bacterium]